MAPHPDYLVAGQTSSLHRGFRAGHRDNKIHRFVGFGSDALCFYLLPEDEKPYIKPYPEECVKECAKECVRDWSWEILSKKTFESVDKDSVDPTLLASLLWTFSPVSPTKTSWKYPRHSYLAGSYPLWYAHQLIHGFPPSWSPKDLDIFVQNQGESSLDQCARWTGFPFDFKYVDVGSTVKKSVELGEDAHSRAKVLIPSPSKQILPFKEVDFVRIAGHVGAPPISPSDLMASSDLSITSFYIGAFPENPEGRGPWSVLGPWILENTWLMGPEEAVEDLKAMSFRWDQSFNQSFDKMAWALQWSLNGLGIPLPLPGQPLIKDPLMKPFVETLGTLELGISKFFSYFGPLFDSTHPFYADEGVTWSFSFVDEEKAKSFVEGRRAEKSFRPSFNIPYKVYDLTSVQTPDISSFILLCSQEESGLSYLLDLEGKVWVTDDTTFLSPGLVHLEPHADVSFEQLLAFLAGYEDEEILSPLFDWREVRWAAWRRYLKSVERATKYIERGYTMKEHVDLQPPQVVYGYGYEETEEGKVGTQVFV